MEIRENIQFSSYSSFTSFAADNTDKLFRYWIYKRLFTPLEQEKKYIDQSEYEDNHCVVAYIVNVIDLQNGDYLIGFLDADSVHDGCFRNIQYCKLSEIRLEWYEGDSNEYKEKDLE